MTQNTNAVQDSHIQIHVSDDLMSAEVDLYPPGKGGRSFTVHSIISELAAVGVTWGIDEKGLEAGILKCLESESPLRGLIAAKGRKPRKSVPSYWHVKKRLIASQSDDASAMNVDYRQRSPYILVKKGEPLAKKVVEADGEAGKNVSGEILPAGVKDIISYRPGDNLIEKDDVLYAAAHGRFEIKDRVMSVNETLEITGNVDYSTGHIAFPGDVIIHGAVCDGFQVAAGKSIFVKQTMDASRVLSRGDLVVEGGIKGRGEAMVRVDGVVKAKFIENASIEAHGDIIVEKAVMHSDIFTLHQFNLGEAGVLVGGEVWAQNSIMVGHIGRPDSPAACLRVGSDYIVHRKINAVRKQIDRLDTKLEKIRVKSTINVDREKLLSQGEEVLEKLRVSEAELSRAQHPNPHARIVVFGRIDEGTDIHICNLSMKISSPMENTVFYYDAELQRVATRGIVESDKLVSSEAD